MITAVITTCQGSPAILKRAISSVIAQTCKDLELIIVDDSPKDYKLRDNIHNIVKSFQEKNKNIFFIVHKDNFGVSAARNTAIKRAKGEYIAFLDENDEWLPGKLDVQLRKFSTMSSDAGLVYCRYYSVDDRAGIREEIRTPGHEGKIFGTFIRENIITSPSLAMVSIKSLRHVGGFVADSIPYDDWDMWIRISGRYEVGFIDIPLVLYHERRTEQDIRLKIWGREYLYARYRKYILSHPYINCKKLSELSALYFQAGQYIKAFNYFMKALPLMPLRFFVYIYETLRREIFR